MNENDPLTRLSAVFGLVLQRCYWYRIPAHLQHPRAYWSRFGRRGAGWLGCNRMGLDIGHGHGHRGPPERHLWATICDFVRPDDRDRGRRQSTKTRTKCVPRIGIRLDRGRRCPAPFCRHCWLSSHWNRHWRYICLLRWYCRSLAQQISVRACSFMLPSPPPPPPPPRLLWPISPLPSQIKRTTFDGTSLTKPICVSLEVSGCHGRS